MKFVKHPKWDEWVCNRFPHIVIGRFVDWRGQERFTVSDHGCVSRSFSTYRGAVQSARHLAAEYAAEESR